MSIESEHLLKQACAWLSKLHSGEFSPVQQQQLTAWRAADPAHDRAWRQAQALWQGMEGLRGRTIPGSEPLLQEPASRLKRGNLPGLTVRPELVEGRTVKPFMVRQAHHERLNLRLSLLKLVDKERYRKTRSPHAAQPRFRRRLLSLAVACSAVLAMTVCYPPSLMQADYSTGKGEQRSVILADGSRVTLNTDSALAIHFDDSVRRVELLQGEAFFEVAKREHQPFVVTAEGRSVRAVGTAFNVQLRPSQTKVELVEGIVEIEDGQHRERLHAGQTALIGADHIAVPTASPSANMALWREGYLQFDGLPLREAVAQINRYRPGRVLLLNDDLADKRVSGLFRLDALDQALAGLKSAVPELQTVGITPYLVVLR